MDLTPSWPAALARRRGVLTLAVLLAALALGAADAERARADDVACRGSALRVAGLAGVGGIDAEPAVANRDGAPCAADARRIVTVPDALTALLSAGALEAETTRGEAGGSATGRITGLAIAPLLLGGVQAAALEATAGYQCADGAPTPFATGHVAGLRLLNVPQEATIDTPLTLTVPGVATVHLNETVTTETSVTRTALRVELLGTLPLLGSLLGVEVVAGEATASLAGNPCPRGRTGAPPVDPSLTVPAIDDGPAARTPLREATFLYHAVDAGVTLECRLDGGPWEACGGRSTYRDLPLGAHCFEVRARRDAAVGPAARWCWTIVALPPGCVAASRHGYFINAASTWIGARRLLFHATTRGATGEIMLSARTGRGRLSEVVYRLDGSVVGRGATAVLRYSQLDRDAPHTLRVSARAGGRRATIARHFRYVNYVAVDCDGRAVVGALRARTVRVGGARVSIVPIVPNAIQGTQKLRFVVRPERRHVLSRVRFALDDRPVRTHLRSVALVARQLRADGAHTLTVSLVPRSGRAATVSIPFRTEAR